MRAEALTRHLGGKWHGSYGTSRCPAHEDKKPSLSLRDSDSGREPDDIVKHCSEAVRALRIASFLRASSRRKKIRPRTKNTKKKRFRWFSQLLICVFFVPLRGQSLSISESEPRSME